MVTIIAGSRGHFVDVVQDTNLNTKSVRYIGKQPASIKLIEQAVELSGFHVTEVVCGMADGVDALGLNWAYMKGVSVKEMPVTKQAWTTYGKKAGMLRNAAMGQYAKKHNGGCIIIWDGISPGSRGMLEIAKALGLMLYVMEV